MNINVPQNEYYVEKDPGALVNLMLANIEHARHVENERLSFNSIYIAVVAGFFALAFDFNKPLLTIFFIGILLAISVVGLLFTKRWTDVFDEHFSKAKEISKMLYGDEEYKNGEEPLVNKYYYFEHNYVRHTARQYIKKNSTLTYAAAKTMAEKNSKTPWGVLCRIRTKHLFYFFYGIVIAVLLVFFVYSIIQVIL